MQFFLPTRPTLTSQDRVRRPIMQSVPRHSYEQQQTCARVQIVCTLGRYLARTLRPSRNKAGVLRTRADMVCHLGVCECDKVTRFLTESERCKVTEQGLFTASIRERKHWGCEIELDTRARAISDRKWFAAHMAPCRLVVRPIGRKTAGTKTRLSHHWVVLCNPAHLTGADEIFEGIFQLFAAGLTWHSECEKGVADSFENGFLSATRFWYT